MSFALTLRYQFHPGKVPWYLAANYFDPESGTLLHFVSTNTASAVEFPDPRTLRSTLLCAWCNHLLHCASPGPAIQFCYSARIHFRVCHYLRVDREGLSLRRNSSMLVPSSRVSSFRGSRFCGPLETTPRNPAASGNCCPPGPHLSLGLSRYPLSSGHTGSTKTPGASLRNWLDRAAPGDQVWVNHDAVEAVDFYLQGKDNRFVYGKFHGDAPQKYVPELLRSIDQHTDRIWLVFSHLQQPSDHAEQQLIVNSLRTGWDVHSVLDTHKRRAFRRTSKNVSIGRACVRTPRRVWDTNLPVEMGRSRN